MLKFNVVRPRLRRVFALGEQMHNSPPRKLKALQALLIALGMFRVCHILKI
jgi:hypothetical protein